MDDDQGCSERRRSFRVGVLGNALLWHGNQIAGRFRLVDLSIGGCQLRGKLPAEDAAEFELVIELGAYGAMRLPAKLVRQRLLSRSEHELGMMFSEHPPATEDRIHDLVMANLEAERPMGGGRVLHVDPNVARRRALRESISPLGYTVIESDSAVDAVWELENGPADFHAVLVSRWLERADGRDLVRFIGERYEGVHRVLIADSPEPGSHAADCVLEGPFDRAHLRVGMPKALRMHSSPSAMRVRSA
jgi:CheY-like chemotaxis protein